MEVVLETFCNEIKSKINEKDTIINKLNEIHDSKNLEIENLKNQLVESNGAKQDLVDEITNLNKVSLLKSIHLKYDKVKNNNNILKKQLEHYKNKLNATCVSAHFILPLETSSDLEEFSSEVSNFSTIEKNLTTTNIDRDEDSESDEEVDVELIKIKKRYYYCEDSGDEKIIYKSVKIKKGDYDVGDRIGILVDGILQKD